MASEFSYDLKITKDRLAALIGVKGKTKKEIEELTKTSIEVDSKEGDIIVSGDDSLGLFSAREIIKAIGRGFNPDVAKQLIKPDFAFEVLNIGDYAKTQSSALRLKGRVIGKEGKARATIEGLTDTSITVYGKTIGIIGETEKVSLAKKAIDMLLTGSVHSSVYQWLEKKRRVMKQPEL